MDKALEKFGDDIAIAFSGAEDVALIEYAKLTGRPFRVFSLDTGRLNPETYHFFDQVEKHYGIRIEYMFPDAVEVQALVRNKGLFSFYEDGHQECCRVRKVDPVFEGLDVGAGSLIKWNPMANVEGQDVWKFLRTMDVPVNSLHSKGYISILVASLATRPVLPGQHEREGRPGIENLLKLENRRNHGLWCSTPHGANFAKVWKHPMLKLADKLAGSGVKVGKFRADGDQKEFSKQELQLGSFPTILFFPKHSSRPIKYPSEKRDVDSLMTFVNALR
uniref:Phosphoadenosine phosphosulphate reductase domain-containing protein n=1 Tax=Populus alba TaxID=43335 RepID=A0A4U5Q4G6_POPAL|nr:hypothetical protein D5086_0000136710 [Populus alba]